MPFIDYNRDIPDGPHNPSTDQPDMKTNTNSIDDIIKVDHFSFKVPLGGLHKQVRLPLSGGPPGTIPAGLVAGEGTLYTKTVTSTGLLEETGLFYSPDGSGNEYQLTRTVTGNFTLFGTNTAYQNPGAPTANNPTITGGWTFLPGGLLMMYGFATPVGTTGIINFPFSFSAGSPFSVTLNLERSNSSATIEYYLNNVSPTQINYTTKNSTSGNGIYFTAIG